MLDDECKHLIRERFPREADGLFEAVDLISGLMNSGILPLYSAWLSMDSLDRYIYVIFRPAMDDPSERRLELAREFAISELRSRVSDRTVLAFNPDPSRELRFSIPLELSIARGRKPESQ